MVSVVSPGWSVVTPKLAVVLSDSVFDVNDSGVVAGSVGAGNATRPALWTREAGLQVMKDGGNVELVDIDDGIICIRNKVSDHCRAYKSRTSCDQHFH